MPLRVIYAYYLSNWTIQYLAPFVKLKPPLFDNIIDLDGYLIRVEHEKVVFDEQWWSVPFFFLLLWSHFESNPQAINPNCYY